MADDPDHRPQWRLECLRLANTSAANAGDVITLAAQFYEYVMHGHSEGLPPSSGQVGQIFETLHKLETQGTTLMTTVADIQAQQVALLAEVTANTDAITSVATFVNGLKSQITDLQAQLAAAGSDPAALAAVSDGLAQVKAGLDAQAVALAAVSNTPAAPPPAPAPAP